MKATRWLSSELEEAGDTAIDDVDSWLGSEDIAESPLARLLGVAGIDELRMRAFASTDGTFRTQHEAEWKILEGNTPALKRTAVDLKRTAVEGGTKPLTRRSRSAFFLKGTKARKKIICTVVLIYFP